MCQLNELLSPNGGTVYRDPYHPYHNLSRNRGKCIIAMKGKAAYTSEFVPRIQVHEYGARSPSQNHNSLKKTKSSHCVGTWTPMVGKSYSQCSDQTQTEPKLAPSAMA